MRGVVSQFNLKENAWHVISLYCFTGGGKPLDLTFSLREPGAPRVADRHRPPCAPQFPSRQLPSFLSKDGETVPKRDSQAAVTCACVASGRILACQYMSMPTYFAGRELRFRDLNLRLGGAPK